MTRKISTIGRNELFCRTGVHGYHVSVPNPISGVYPDSFPRWVSQRHPVQTNSSRIGSCDERPTNWQYSRVIPLYDFGLPGTGGTMNPLQKDTANPLAMGEFCFGTRTVK